MIALRVTFLFAGSPAAESGDITGRYLGHDPTSEEHYTTVREWIEKCAAHPKCRQTVSGSENINPDESPLPARCVEVSERGKRLYLRETDGTTGRYLTLTHRWNQETEGCKTTSANYQERLKGRGFRGLPQLFQDVFIIAEKLNVPYVWIDSICIIQYGDAGADWRKEAPKMAEYYQKSLLTIAGTMSNMDNGLLKSHPDNFTPWESKLVQLPYRDQANKQAGYFYVYKRKVCLVDDYWAMIRESILFKRGWILQEWLLSKRLLWYTSKGLFFECHTDTPRTDGQEQISYSVAKPDLRSHLELKATFHFSNPSILEFWYHALEVYSACHLTKPDQDRILAVAGLAKEVARILGNTKPVGTIPAGGQNEIYTSGLWLRDIHHGLLWEESHSAQPWTTRVRGAPSWSWASLMTQVKWPEKGENTQEEFEITGVCLRRRAGHDAPEHPMMRKSMLQRLGNAYLGNIVGGSQWEGELFDPTNMFSCLHIRGKLHTVHIRGYLETEDKLYTAAFSTVYGTTPTSCQWRAVCSPTRPEIIAGWGSLEQLSTDGTTCVDFGVAVYALHVSTRYLQNGIWIKWSDPILDVLFLEEVDVGSNVYQRLGVGRIADGDLIKDFHKAEVQDIQLI